MAQMPKELRTNAEVDAAEATKKAETESKHQIAETRQEEATPEVAAVTDPVVNKGDEVGDDRGSAPVVETDIRPVRGRRRLPSQSPMDEQDTTGAILAGNMDGRSAAQIQAAVQGRMDDADTSQYSQEELNALEVDNAVERRIRSEAHDEEALTLAGEAQIRDTQMQEDHAQRMADYEKRAAARMAAHPQDALETPEGMTRVVIMKNVTIVREDGTSDTFTTTGTNCGIPGTWDMDEWDAKHWYVQLHSDNPPPDLPPQPGTQAARVVREKQSSRRALIEAALDQEELDASAELRAKRHERLKKALGDSYDIAS